MSTIEVNTINPQSGNDITIGGSSKNVKFPSGTTVDFSTNTPTVTLGAAMKMTPAFLAYSSVDQTLSNTTITKYHLIPRYLIQITLMIILLTIGLHHKKQENIMLVVCVLCKVVHLIL